MPCSCKGKSNQAQQAAQAAQRREASEIRKLAEQQAKDQARANAQK